MPTDIPGNAGSAIWEHLTEQARKSLKAAEAQAISLRHEHISDVHLLLGVLADPNSPASHLIASLNASSETLQTRLIGFYSVGATSAQKSRSLTPRTRQVLELARTEALTLGHRYIGTEHLLLGIAREEKGPAARILAGRGLRYETLLPVATAFSGGNLDLKPPAQTEQSTMINSTLVTSATLSQQIMPSFMSSVTQTTPDAIRQLLEHIPHNHPVRRVTESFLEKRELPEDAPSVLFEALMRPSSFIWRPCVVAVWMLGQLPLLEAQAQAATERLIYLLKEWPRLEGRKRFFRSTGIALISATVVMYCLNSISPIGTDRIIDALAIFGTLFFPLSWVSLYVIERGHRYIRAQSAQALGTLGGIEGLEALAAAALEGELSEVRNWAQWSLRRVLPRLTPDHYGRLSGRPLPLLCRLLRSDDEVLVLIILDALGKVGDGSVVKSVESESNHGPTISIRRAAYRILPLLKERQAKENSSLALLRASAAPESTPDTLLRPANAGNETDSSELLRPDLGVEADK